MVCRPQITKYKEFWALTSIFIDLIKPADFVNKIPIIPVGINSALVM